MHVFPPKNVIHCWLELTKNKTKWIDSIVSSPEQTIHHDFAPGVHLDQHKSSKTGDVLYLYDLDLTSEGRYRCEVSADYTFQTIKMDSYMTVIGKSSFLPIHSIV